VAAGDVALREAERVYELAQTEDNLAVLNRERRRRGMQPVNLSTQTLAVLAVAGDRLAAEGGPVERVQKKLTGAEAERVVTASLRAQGYSPDRWHALVSPDGRRRFKFKARVTEEYEGRSGAWSKLRSLSTIGFAMSLWARARDLAGLEGIVIREKRQKEKDKRAERAAKENLHGLAIRLATVRLSGQLSPQQRHDQAFGVDRLLKEQVDGEALHLGPEASGATEDQIDALLSLDVPPVFVVPSMRKEARRYPDRYSWIDPSVGEVKVRLANKRLIAINMGHIPVDPVTGSFSPTLGSFREWQSELAEEGRHGGLAAKLYQNDDGSVVPSLFMFTPHDYAHAVVLIRAFCRLLQAYNLRRFMLEGVTEGEAETLRQLHDAEVITILKTSSGFYARCDLALEDPHQRRMFHGGR